MMVRVMCSVGFAVVLALSGCERGTASADPPDTDHGGQPSTEPEAGKASRLPDDDTSRGGAAEPDTEIGVPCGDVPQPWCLLSCADPEALPAQCVDQVWQCPEGAVDRTTCPKDSCGVNLVRCCADNGEGSVPECGPDGLFEECAEGLTRNTSNLCIPAGLEIESCHELVPGSSCASDDLVCFTPGCTGGKCYCRPDEESGELVWGCYWNAC